MSATQALFNCIHPLQFAFMPNTVTKHLELMSINITSKYGLLISCCYYRDWFFASFANCLWGILKCEWYLIRIYDLCIGQFLLLNNVCRILQERMFFLEAVILYLLSNGSSAVHTQSLSCHECVAASRTTIKCIKFVLPCFWTGYKFSQLKWEVLFHAAPGSIFSKFSSKFGQAPTPVQQALFVFDIFFYFLAAWLPIFSAFSTTPNLIDTV